MFGVGGVGGVGGGGGGDRDHSMSSRLFGGRDFERKKSEFQIKCLDGATKRITVQERDLESYTSFEKAIAQKLDIKARKDDVEIIIGYNGDVLSEENFALYTFNENNTLVVCCYYRENENENEIENENEYTDEDDDDGKDEVNDEDGNVDQAQSPNASREDNPEQVFYNVLYKIATTITSQENNGNGGGDGGDGGGREEEVRPLPEVQPSLIRQLQDIGITEVKARNALLLCQMNLDRAADYALTHNDPEDEVPITAERYWRAMGRPRVEYRSRFGRQNADARRLLLRALLRSGFVPQDMRPRNLPMDIDLEGLTKLGPFWAALSNDPEFARAVREESDVCNDFKTFLEDPRGFNAATPTTIARLSPLFERYGDLVLSI